MSSRPSVLEQTYDHQALELVSSRRYRDAPANPPGGSPSPDSRDGVRLGSMLLLLWMSASAGTGLLVALLVRRIHPSLLRSWLYYSVLLALLIGVVLVVGLT